MRIITCLITILLLSASVKLVAQNATPRFTKGYYAIGDNWKKLKPAVIIPVDTTSDITFEKGYHSIDTSSTVLPKKNVWFNKSPRKPVFSKGYTTIGSSSNKD